MNNRHSRTPSDGEGLSFGPGGPSLNLSRATPIKPQLGIPPMALMTQSKESRDQAQAWDISLNRIFQTMQGEDTAKYLNYFKARLEIEETYTRALEKLALPGKVSKNNSSTANNNSGGSGGPAVGGNSGGGVTDPEDIPTTLQLAFDALLETTQQAFLRRRPFTTLIRNLIGALTGLKESQEKQRKIQKETARPVFQLYAETRLSTVPKLKRSYEQKCREVEQVLSMEDSEHLPVRERLKNLANSSGAAGRLVKCRKDMEDADAEYKTAVQSLETYRLHREKCFDTAYKVMQSIVKERSTKCRQCLEAFVVGERDMNTRAASDVDRFSVVVDCIKPAGDMDQLCMSFTKDVNSHPKPVMYENYYTKNVPESVFGTNLSDYARRYRHPIPLVIVKCADAIDRSGLRREGIYRVSGRHAQIMNLKKMFELNEDTVDLTDPTYSEDHASIAAVLKIYLRELPEPLFPFPLNERSIYSANQDPNARLHELKIRLKRLPDCNIDTLQYLIQHLRRIYENVEFNKMSLENLSMIFTPAVFHDFNSAMTAGPQAPTPLHASPEASTSSLMALSFGAQGGATSPSSPSATANWTSYPLSPTDQHQPATVLDRVPQSGLSPSLHGQGSGSAILSTSPSNNGSSMSPTHSTFNTNSSNTVSAAASWTNDLVMSDLILNSHNIFDVLPKLPARTNSMIAADEQVQYQQQLQQQQQRQQLRQMNASMANTNLRVDSSYGNLNNNVPPPTVRQFNNSRKSSSSSIGTIGAPASPIEGGYLKKPEPRYDSLGPHSGGGGGGGGGRQSVRSSDSSEHQSYLPQQQPPYQLPPSPSHISGAAGLMQQNQLYGQFQDVTQAGRSNTPPSPSVRAALAKQRSKSNADLYQQYQHYQQLEQQYQPQTQYRPSPPPQEQHQQSQQQRGLPHQGHRDDMTPSSEPLEFSTSPRQAPSESSA
ncbi:hypothetical protein BG004_005723 [Podila humilis]|nr:hypothetical protein BG004_005723 [Podila humilis]